MMLRVCLVLAALLGWSVPASACTCSNGGPRAARARSTAVFLGRVLSVSAAPLRSEPYGDVAMARFVVSQSIKGVSRNDTVMTQYLVGTGGNCGLVLKPGMRLLVYAAPAKGSGSQLWTDYCAGTKGLECAEFDLEQLEVPAPAGVGDCRPPLPKSGRPTPSRRALSDPPSNESLQQMGAWDSTRRLPRERSVARA
jgi:hypothetical protein